MVSFQCDNCADTVKKPALDKHRNRCWGTFTCLDCSTTFQGTEYKSHTACISEAEKYEKTLYKGGKGGQKNGHSGNNSAAGNNRFQPYPKGKPAGGRNGTPAAPPPMTENPAQDPTQAGSAPAVHPSRANIIEASSAGSGAKPSFPSLHPPSRYPPPRERPGWQNGRRVKVSATGMNNVVGEVPMRSWGTSPAVTDTEDGPGPNGSIGGNGFNPTGLVEVKEKKKNKNKKKGDKGGTGSRANSNAKKLEAEASAGPSESTPVATPKPVEVAPAPALAPVPAVVAAPTENTNGDSSSVKKSKKEKKSKSDSALAAPAVGESPSAEPKKEKKSRKHSEMTADAAPASAETVGEGEGKKQKKSKKSKTEAEGEVKEKKSKKEGETSEERAARKAAKKAKKAAA